MEFRNLNPIRPRPNRRRTSAREVGIAAAALVLPPLVIGAALYSTLAPFDNATAVQPQQAPPPANSNWAPGRDDAAEDVRLPEVPPMLALAPPAPPGAAAPPPAAPPKRTTATVRRHPQRPQQPPQPPPQQDDGGFPQQVKGWFQDRLQDIGVVSRDGDTSR